MTIRQQIFDFIREKGTVTSNELRQAFPYCTDIRKNVSSFGDNIIHSKRGKFAVYTYKGSPKVTAEDFIFTSDGRAIRKQEAKQLRI